MNTTYKDLMDLFAYSATDNDIPLKDNYDLMQIFKLSNDANIWTFVFNSIKKLYNEGKIDVSEDTFNTLNATVLYKISKSSQKIKNVHSVIKTLEDNGIDVIVLKGESLSHLYKIPYLRTSSDADLLIDEKFEDKALDIMKNLGIEIHKKSAVSHHTRCTSDKIGLIELHTDVYEDYLDELYFDNIPIETAKFVNVSTDDNFILKTLNYDDYLLFLTFHYIKHFLQKGCGLKQVMDLLLYIKHYKENLDFAKYLNILKMLKFDVLIETTIGIGIKYFKFNKSDFFDVKYDDDTVDNLVIDIIEGGAFGNAEIERKRFEDEFLKSKLNKGYKKYKLNFNKNFFVKSASFKKDTIYKKYTYVQKNKALLPVAYVNHIYYIVISSFKHIFMKKENLDSNFIENRLDLMKKMKIL